MRVDTLLTREYRNIDKTHNRLEKLCEDTMEAWGVRGKGDWCYRRTEQIADDISKFLSSLEEGYMLNPRQFSGPGDKKSWAKYYGTKKKQFLYPVK